MDEGDDDHDEVVPDDDRWWQHQVAIPAHPLAAMAQVSNRIIMRAILATATREPRPRTDMLKRFLTHALRYNGAPTDERNRWQRIVYRTQGTVSSATRPTEEHVVTNKWFCKVLLNDAARWSADDELVKLLSLQVRCLVSREEHDALGSGFGWTRYLTPVRVPVFDCTNRPMKEVAIDALAREQRERVQALGLSCD